MKTRLTSTTLLICIITTMLISCYDANNKSDSIASADKYSVYIANNLSLYDTYFEFDNYDFSSEKRYTFPDPETLVGIVNSVVKSDVDDFELTLNNETEIYKYKYSYNSPLYLHELTPLNYFEDADSGASVSVYSDTEELCAVKLNDKSFKITDSPIITEDELLDVCNCFLSQYTDLLSVRPEITTSFYGADGKLEEVKDGFKNLSDTQLMYKAEYYVQYDWIQNDFKRFRYARIRITNEGDLLSFEITKKSYSEILSNAEIDYDKVNSIIEEKVKKLCENDAGYAFESIDYYEKGIYVIEGRLCAAVILSPFLSAPGKNYPVRGFPITLLITL